MRLININDVPEGSVIAKPVYDSKLSLLINTGAVLTSKLLEKLKQVDIRHLYIEDEISRGIVLEPMISDEIKLQTIVYMKELYDSQLIKENNNDADLAQQAVREGQIRELKHLIDDIITEIYARNNKKYYSTELMGAEMYHYNHAVEVMILSLLIGSKMGLDRERLLKLGVGAILADIGKTRVPQEILNKKGKLEPAEFEEMKLHVDYGYHLLKNLVGLSSLSRQIILLHHEKLDGSGYPNGFTGENIPLLVRIVTVCDIFGAIVSDRNYNNRISVDTALEILRSATPTKLDQDVFHKLMEVVDIYPPGSIIELSNGKVGIVMFNNPNSPTRPVVRLIDATISNEADKIVDLMKDLTVFVKKVLPKLPE